MYMVYPIRLKPWMQRSWNKLSRKPCSAWHLGYTTSDIFKKYIPAARSLRLSIALASFRTLCKKLGFWCFLKCWGQALYIQHVAFAVCVHIYRSKGSHAPIADRRDNHQVSIIPMNRIVGKAFLMTKQWKMKTLNRTTCIPIRRRLF